MHHIKGSTRVAIIHLVEGLVGAGKSTFAGQLGLRHAAPCLILDDWMVTLFTPDRPQTAVMEWYLERKHRCIEQIWKLTREILATGTDVVLELGLLQGISRQVIYDRVDESALNLANKGVRYRLELQVLSD